VAGASLLAAADPEELDDWPVPKTLGKPCESASATPAKNFDCKKKSNNQKLTVFEEFANRGAQQSNKTVLARL
jgi:hypothetical protein